MNTATKVLIVAGSIAIPITILWMSQQDHAKAAAEAKAAAAYGKTLVLTKDDSWLEHTGPITGGEVRGSGEIVVTSEGDGKAQFACVLQLDSHAAALAAMQLLIDSTEVTVECRGSLEAVGDRWTITTRGWTISRLP